MDSTPTSESSGQGAGGRPADARAPGDDPSAPLAVRLYAVDAAAVDAARYERFASLLDGTERERAERFVFERHRRRFVVAHGFLREALARETGEPARSLVFAQDPGGKPRLAGGAVRFSLSHSGERALLAVADAEVGLDLEEIRPARVELALAERVMTPQEFRDFARATRDAQVSAFFRLWSAKESVMKACGLGLALAPASFAVLRPGTLELATMAQAPSGTREPGGAWRLTELQAPAGFAAALASPRDARVTTIGSNP